MPVSLTTLSQSAAPPSAPPPGTMVHVVRAGETLSSIAARHGTTVGAIARANSIANPDRIYVGQSIDVAAPRMSGDSYTVRGGDTLGAIAELNGTTVGALQRLNGLRNIDLIHPGQTLLLRGRGSAPATIAHPAAPAAAAPSTGRLSEAGLAALAARESQRGVSNRLHWPGGASGVTLGPGYDMRHRSSAEIVRDLTAVGVDRASAQAVSRASGLAGSAARDFVARHRGLVDISAAQETALLRNVVPGYAEAVAEAVRIPLTQNQFDALVSFAFNIGLPAFRDSTLLRRLNAGNLAAVPSEMRRWNKSDGQVVQGLVNRREAEIAQFETQSPASAAPMREADRPATGTPGSAADFAARIMADGDARARADLAAGRKVVLALRTPTNTGANGGGGRYDDTIAVVQKRADGSFTAQTFRANTDPSGRYDGRYGRDINGDGRMELGSLMEGSYRYTRQSGTFQGHVFWRPDATTAVRRDTNHDGVFTSADGVDQSGAGRSILIHAGGRTITGSAGCQTMTAADLNRFAAALGSQNSFSYVLTR